MRTFLIDKIDNIIYTSGRRIMGPELQPIALQYYCHMSPSVSRDQYTALLLEGVLVTLYGRDTVLSQFLETVTSDRTLISLHQLLRFSGLSLYTLSFFLYSTFNILSFNNDVLYHF